MDSQALSVSSDTLLLVAALRERDALIEAQRLTIIAQRDEIERQGKELALLQREVKRLLSHRKDDHLIAEGQLTLFGDDAAQTDEVVPEHISEAPDGETPEDSIKNRHKPKRRSRKVDLSALPRETVTHELAENERVCPTTGLPLIAVGEKVFEEIDFTPAQIRVIEHHRIEYGLAPQDAQERHVVPIVAPGPPRPLEGCKASAGLLAQILVQKYLFHLPLYRQEEVFQQAGLSIPRQTLCDWVMGAAFQLRPVVEEMMRQIRAGPVLQLDDTPVKCRGAKGSGYYRAYLWTLVNPEANGVVYRFTPGRAAKEIEPLIEGLEGYLVGDGYAGHFAAAKEVDGIIGHGGCWAHVFRKYRDAKKEGGRMAGMFMSDIAKLFTIEDKAKDAKMGAEARRTLRVEEGRPILARLLRRTRGWEDVFSTSGKMGTAIKYMRNQWKTLKCFLEDGRVPIHNNACELAIRTIAVGRRNWLFAGSERGGEAAVSRLGQAGPPSVRASWST
ncbi:MAG: IS66 family transposase [bacterium]|nr:IS66 family transposase [bacterium]